MNTRFASAAAAVVLGVSALATPALAQSYTAPAGISAAAAPGSHEARSYDDITTGSIGYGRDYTSAQQGNAEQNNFPVWQFGRTSGGTAR
jgi:hypothetical protein